MASKNSKPRLSADAKYLGEKLDQLLSKIEAPVTITAAKLTATKTDDGIFRDNKVLAANEAVAKADARFKVGCTYTLEWAPTIDGRHAYANALKACKDLRTGGHADWTLPEIHELESLRDLTKHNPASSAPGMKADWYWSATPFASSPSGCAWGVDFGGGDVHWNDQDLTGLVRACRRVPPRQ